MLSVTFSSDTNTHSSAGTPTHTPHRIRGSLAGSCVIKCHQTATRWRNHHFLNISLTLLSSAALNQSVCVGRPRGGLGLASRTLATRHPTAGDAGKKDEKKNAPRMKKNMIKTIRVTLLAELPSPCQLSPPPDGSPAAAAGGAEAWGI